MRYIYHIETKRGLRMNLLNEVMELKGVKAKELSRLSGVSETTISKIKNGADARLSTMVELFDAMGLKLTYVKK